MPTELAPTSPSLAERLNLLFDTCYRPGLGPYTSAEVLTALRRAGRPMSPPYLSQLRTGQRRNPSSATIAALAQFFGVPPAYFTDDDRYQQLATELTEHLHLRDPTVRRIGERLRDLSPRALAEIASYLEGL
jgi:transcriptional regulator with XRE-family HTH domain